MKRRFNTESEQDTLELGRLLSSEFSAGDIVLFVGELGAGKTTLIRGILSGIGYLGSVRSPTFNLLQVYATDPPVLHGDLYRLSSAVGLGLEDYEGTHLWLVEWPDRLGGLVDEEGCWKVEIDFQERGRLITVEAPATPN